MPACKSDLITFYNTDHKPCMHSYGIAYDYSIVSCSEGHTANTMLLIFCDLRIYNSSYCLLMSMTMYTTYTHDHWHAVFCEGEHYLNYSWADTAIGSIATAPCPCSVLLGDTGRIKRECSSDVSGQHAVWSIELDFSICILQSARFNQLCDTFLVRKLLIVFDYSNAVFLLFRIPPHPMPHYQA